MVISISTVDNLQKNPHKKTKQQEETFVNKTEIQPETKPSHSKEEETLF